MIACGAFFALPSFAASGRSGAVLLETLGARNVGIGNAMTALGDDLSALHANPAGLASSDYNEINLDIARTEARDLKLGASTGVPVGRKATIAVGVFGFGSSNDINLFRIDNQGNRRQSSFALDEDDGLLHIAGARFVRPDLSVGVGVKYLRSSIVQSFVQEEYEGLFGDAGVRYNSATSGFVAAVAVRNIEISSRARASLVAEPDIPLTSSAGISYGRLISTAHYVNLSGEIVHREHLGTNFRAGAEYWMANLFGVRAGYDALERGREWRAGMSLSFHGTLLDLAYVPNRDAWEYSEIYGTLKFTFGGGRKR